MKPNQDKWSQFERIETIAFIIMLIITIILFKTKN